MLAAARGRTHWLWLSLAVIVADRASKYAIERFTSADFRHDVIPNFAVLVHSVNLGIAFGILSDSASKTVAMMLIGSSAAVVLLLVWILITGHAGDQLSHAGLALIAGGATGNLLDRVMYGGVTDFVELHAGRFEWPAFNLADTAITVGALLLILALLRGGQHTHEERA